MTTTLFGIDRLRKEPDIASAWGRCGLLCNQASVASDFTPSWHICREILGERLACFFSPQHGLAATVQDNMIETPSGVHKATNLPIHSLYHNVRQPTAAMLEGLETIIIDLQISGTRVYTFKYTIAGILRAAAQHGIQIVVLDRPNPLGGEVLEGRILSLAVKSFVGEYEMPMRHGMTAGEFALFCNRLIGAQLRVIELEGWQPTQLWSELDREWVLTSPNLPTFSSVLFYVGNVLFEGTNISEGRGTCLPFQLIGAPYLDGQRLVEQVKQLYAGRGAYLRETEFQPVAQKWQDCVCYGLQTHCTDAYRLRSYSLALAILRACLVLGAEKFQWQQPPYEYEYHKPPIKLLLGSEHADRHFLTERFDVRDAYWHEGLEEYRREVSGVLLYKRDMLI